jgi:3-oxoacyl-[acyl-carrier-protein] synthase II
MSGSIDGIVITGLGAVTGCGDDEAFRAAWLAGASAVRAFDKDAEGLPPGFGAQAAYSHSDVRKLPGGRGLRPGTMTEYTFLACGAVGRALQSAGLHVPEKDTEAVMDRRGIYLGSYTNFPRLKKHTKLTHVMGSPSEAQKGKYVIDDGRISEGMRGFTGFDFLQLMNNMPTAHASIQAAARGPANTLLGHATVGLQAVGKAVDGLRLGIADQFVAGGTGPGTSEGLCAVRHGNHLLASVGGDVTRAARPLDRSATGLVPGDIGAAVVLETRACAEARGAVPLARVVAWSDAFAAPNTPRGGLSDAGPLARLLHRVLAQAGWSPSDVDYVAASGLGLPAVDLGEAAALAAVFGPALPDVAIAVHTGITGFGEGAHAALGLVGALQAMNDGMVPPQVNLDEPWDPLRRMSRIHVAAERVVRRALVVATSPEGSLVALALEAA